MVEEEEPVAKEKEQPVVRLGVPLQRAWCTLASWVTECTLPTNMQDAQAPQAIEEDSPELEDEEETEVCSVHSAA